MQCTILIDSKKLEKIIGETMTEEQFAVFCKDAVAIKLWEKSLPLCPFRALNQDISAE